MFSLFGPAKHFVPPIYVDALFLSAFGVYLSLIAVKNKEKLPLIALVLSFALSSYSELRTYAQDTIWIAWLSAVLLGLAFAGHLLNFSKVYFVSTRITGRKWMLFVLLFLAFCIALLAGLIFPGEHPAIAYLYWLAGMAGLILVWHDQEKKEMSEGNYAFVLLLSLSTLFDFLNYFSLMLL